MKTAWTAPLRSLTGKAVAALAACAVLGGLAASPAMAAGKDWHRSPQRHEQPRWNGHDRQDWRRATYHPRYVYAPPRYVYSAPRYVYAPPPVVYRAPSLNFDFRIPLR